MKATKTLILRTKEALILGHIENFRIEHVLSDKIMVYSENNADLDKEVLF